MNEKTIKRILRFNLDRDWAQFHSPANIAKSISIEAGELLECFQWDEENFDIKKVEEELADVIIYCQDLLHTLKLDEDKIVNDKLSENERKYPVEKAKGSAKKYDKL